MTPLVLLALLLPGLYWDRGPETAEALKKAGVQQVLVPAGTEGAWRATGVRALPADPAKLMHVEAASVQYRMDLASATRIPWVELNGHVYLRSPGKTFYCEPPKGAAALTAAEAFVYGAELVLKPDPADLEALGRLLAFLKRIEQPALPVMANVGLVDDGSEWTGELLKLMLRRNLMVEPVKTPNPKLDLNVVIGSADFSKEAAADPWGFATVVRGKLGDAKRLTRIYGSDVVLLHLTGEGSRARLHLLNFGAGGRPARNELRIRVLGSWTAPKLAVYGQPSAALSDVRLQEGGTEFTLDNLPLYAAVDLVRK